MNSQSQGSAGISRIPGSKTSIRIMLICLFISVIILLFVNYRYLCSYKLNSHKLYSHKYNASNPSTETQFNQHLINRDNIHQGQIHQGQIQTPMEMTIPEPFTQTQPNHPLSNTNTGQKNDKAEPGIVKLAIYHMDGCGHCHAIMHRSGNGEKSLYEKLKDNYANDSKVRIYDFMAGRDKEADVYRFLPVMKIITINSSDEYNGTRDFNSIVEAINKKK